MKMDLSVLRKYQDDRLLSCQPHPKLPLLIWNYTQKVQFGGFWDAVTKQCRGLITDTDGLVIARPFSKFFNIGQVPETCIEALPPEVPDITVKADGSLGILYFNTAGI